MLHIRFDRPWIMLAGWFLDLIDWINSSGESRSTIHIHDVGPVMDVNERGRAIADSFIRQSF